MTKLNARLTLKDKQGVVQSLWTAVNHGGQLIETLPRVVRTLLETRAWAEREVDGKIVRFERFSEFIKADPRRGCGWDPKKVEALLQNDPDVLAMWREAMVGGQGNRNDVSGLHDNVMKSEQGNSRAYTLSRLKRDAPALFARVCAGELSANAAAIEAGFRKKPEPFDQVCKLLPKLTAEELRQLRDTIDERMSGA